MTAAAAGVSALGTAAISSYADFEQLKGGIETLFGTGGVASIEEYAQNVGKSVDEIRGEYETLSKAQELAMQNANNAYKNAGLSANEYMETITGFAASLKQSTTDEVEAATAANQAVIDMADNANKMGTSMESIQNAYQGFAKQNYTMLDNLKLGYGGTKSEMERLLKDAEKIHEETTGEVTHYDINNLADVYAAIHDVQTELGITGTTSKEVATTISGSMNMAKAAWSNLLTGIADDTADFDGLIDGFVESVTAVAGNLIPRIETTLGGVGRLIEQLLPQLINRIPELLEGVIPQLLQSGINMISAVLNGIQSNLASVANSAIDIVMMLVDSFIGMLPQLLETGVQIIVELAIGIANALPTLIQTIATALPLVIETLLSSVDTLAETGYEILHSLIEGIVSGIPEMLPRILEFIQGFADSLAERAPILIEKGFELLSMLVDGIVSAIPILVEQVPTIVSTFANIINDNFPTILLKGVEIILELIKGIISAIPTIVANIPQIVTAIVDVIMAFQWLNLGKNIITFFKNGITSMVGHVKTAGKAVHNAIKNAVTNLPATLSNIGKSAIHNLGSTISGLKSYVETNALKIVSAIESTMLKLPSKMISIGSDIVKGLWNGIANMTGWVVSKIQGFGDSVLSGIKDFFGIHSPSTEFEWIGRMCVAGFDEGMEDFMNTDGITKNVKANLSTLQQNATGAKVFGGTMAGYRGFQQIVNINQPVRTPDEMARAMRLESKYGLIRGDVEYG